MKPAVRPRSRRLPPPHRQPLVRRQRPYNQQPADDGAGRLGAGPAAGGSFSSMTAGGVFAGANRPLVAGEKT